MTASPLQGPPGPASGRRLPFGKLTRSLSAALAAGLLIAAAVACRSGNAPADPSPDASTAVPAAPAVLVSPRSPRAGAPLRVLAAFETDASKVGIALRGPAGAVEPARTRRGGGPPFWVAAEFAASPSADPVVLLRSGRSEIEIGPDARLSAGGGWSRAAEILYSAWIEALFADADERSSWKALHEVTRDRDRNLLHDHLGLGEDEPSGASALEMIPDCADNPYFLRAYFAWKTGLPFGFHETGWGTVESPPQAGRFVAAEPPSPTGAPSPVAAMARLLNQVKNIVHAGNGRTALRADGTDYYPLALTRRALRPGTVYADPYGHTYTLVRWVPQTRGKPGLLLGVDAQPDGTIGVKRFWKGNFLFTTEDVVGEPGFKAFRPIAVESGRPRLLTNAEIAASPDYGDYSLAQEHHGDGRFLRGHGEAHQSRAARRRGRLRGPLPGPPRTAPRPGRFGGQRRSLHAGPSRHGHPHAVGQGRLPDPGPVGGLLDAQPRPAPAHRHRHRPRVPRQGRRETPTAYEMDGKGRPTRSGAGSRAS